MGHDSKIDPRNPYYLGNTNCVFNLNRNSATFTTVKLDGLTDTDSWNCIIKMRGKLRMIVCNI